MALFTKETLQERRAEIVDEIAKIEAVTGPMREARDAFVQEAEAKRRAMDKELKEAEAPLIELRREQALIARALGAKSISIAS